MAYLLKAYAEQSMEKKFTTAYKLADRQAISAKMIWSDLYHHYVHEAHRHLECAKTCLLWL